MEQKQWKINFKTNWEKEEEKKRGRGNVFRIRFLIFGELWDKQLNYYGLPNKVVQEK